MLFICGTNVYVIPCIFGALCWAVGTFKRRKRKMRGGEGDRKEKKRRRGEEVKKGTERRGDNKDS